MARMSFTAASAGTPRRSRPTSTFTKAPWPAGGAAAATARAPSRSVTVGVSPRATSSAIASGSPLG